MEAEEIEIPFDQGILGDDRDRMFALGQYLEDLARDPPFALDRLVRVRICTNGDALATIAGFGKGFAQQLRGVDLGEQPGLEVQPGDSSRYAWLGLA